MLISIPHVRDHNESTQLFYMNLIIRPAKSEDAQICGAICYNAFKMIAEAHHFPPDFPETEMAVGLMNYAFSAAGVFAVVAEENGQIVGSNILWENGLIGGVGPITVDPACQNADVGKKLMEQVLHRAEDIKLAGVRLVQAAYHNRSLALYTKLGFDVQEPLSVIQGTPLAIRFPGYEVRAGNEADLNSCNQLCYKIHGHDRSFELPGAVHTGTFFVVEYDRKIIGYTTQLGFLGHTIATTDTGLKALIGASENFAGPGFLLPTRNAEVLRWCLQNGLRIIEPMTLMSKGLYNEPAGAFLPSVLY
jgi:GNAT superfamily N-acetyltransferase